jgi:prophage antirepressor-like protein
MSSQQEVFDVINNLYHLVDENKVVWFYAKELCEFLEYKKESRKIIKEYIDDENKMSYSKLKKICGALSTPQKEYNASFKDAKPMDNVVLEPTKEDFLGSLKDPRIHGLELFINEEALYELIDKSEMPKANRFKKWTRKILSQIRKGDIKVDDYIAPMQISDNNTPIFFDKSQCDDPNSIYYNKEDELIIRLNNLSRSIDYKNFIDKNVVYFYITSIKNINNIDELVIKIGYSKQITKRYEEHRARFGANFKLIAVKEVNDIDDEQRLHNHIKLKYPESIYYFQIRDATGKKKGADEFYIYSDILLEEFNNFNVDIKSVHKIVTDKDIELRKLDVEFITKSIENNKLLIENNKILIEMFKMGIK